MKRGLLIAVLVLCGKQVLAQTLYVPADGYTSIQSAINDANDGDIIIVAEGTYRENINFLGKAVTVRSADPNDLNVVAVTIIDGNEPDDPNYGSTVIFNSGEDINSVLSGFTITGGTGSWLPIAWRYNGRIWNRCGGAVLCYNMSAPTISKNVFINNTAGQGGGIYIYGDPVDPNDPSNPPLHINPAIADNIFIDNSAIKEHGFVPPDSNYPANDHGDGGAIVGFQGCDAIITGNLIQSNHAASYGGGIHLRQWSNGPIENNHIISNYSSLGGGIHITYNSNPTVRNNTIERNAAGYFGGGGIYVYAWSNPTVEQNIITGNDSVNGAGIAIYFSSEPVIRNNLIFKNKNGAGIRVRGGSTPQIIHNTIADNSAGASSGGVDCTENAAPMIENNIITTNSNGYGIYVDDKSSPVIRYNNVWGNGAGNYGPEMTDQTGINGNISVPAEFIGPDSNDYHLNYASECINSGDPNFTGEPPTDYDSDLRVMGDFIDIGADEAWPVWNTTTGDKYTLIQQAINDANDGDRIIVTPGTYYENLTFNGNNVKLQSIDPNDWDIVEKTIIDGNNADTVVLFESGEDTNCILEGFTITNGQASTDYGGGVRIRNYTGPTIRNNLITSNTAKKGAGICLYHSSARVLNNRVVNNTGTEFGQGGGMMIIDCSEDPNAIIANNIIVGNSTLYGGGIRIQNSTALIVNNVIAYNRASWKGKGVYANGHAVENCIVWGHGGGADDDLYQCTASYSCTESNSPGAGNISADPCFINHGYWDDAGTPSNLGDDFFVYGDYHIRPSSPCIDAGDNNSVPASLNIDIDGEVRIFSSSVDIGADEFVTNPVDINMDWIVDYLDIATLADEWLQSDSELQTDFYEDNFIDFADFAVFAQQWLWEGPCYE